jgi:hypothetical protein
MDIRTLVENSYNKYDDQQEFLAEILAFLFEEKMPTSEAFDWSMIPEIPVSEIGWSDVRTQEGQEVAGPQRKLLEDYLNNIVPAGTLEEKLSALSTFMKDGYKTIAADSGSPADTVKNVMSYLVFYKTLTRVITNFNASSAGFSFESFLATLLGGTQISTGGGTIADFITGPPEKEYVSLKLYSESGVEVGGSFSDLVDDLNNSKMNHRMKYIVVLKRLKGADLDQKGMLSFYTFTFTLDNVADIIAASSKGSTDCIKLPLIPDPEAPPLAGYKTGYRLAMDDPEGIPGRVKVTPEELNTHYQDLARQSLGPFEEVLPGITDSLLARPEFDVTERDEFVKDAVRTIQAAILDQYADSEQALDILNARVVPDSAVKVNLAIAHVLKDAWTETERILKKDPVASRKAKIADILPSLKDSDVKLSQAWYNAQTDPEVKMKALKVSNGYLNTLHFKMGKSLSTTPDEPTFAVPEGQIFIGAEYIAPMIEGVRDILNDEVYSIFSSLKMLSTNLNEFFATGLRDGEKAQVAMTSADNIEKKTGESVKKFGAKK